MLKCIPDFYMKAVYGKFNFETGLSNLGPFLQKFVEVTIKFKIADISVYKNMPSGPKIFLDTLEISEIIG